jgi:hypothetical protein
LASPLGGVAPAAPARQRRVGSTVRLRATCRISGRYFLAFVKYMVEVEELRNSHQKIDQWLIRS